MNSNLKPVSLVTGGSSGIGAAVTRKLARSGMRVVIGFSQNKMAAREIADELTHEGCSATTIRADFQDPREASRCVEQVVADEGRLDVLVNNAALGVPALLENVTADSAMVQVAVNLVAPLLAIRAAAPHLARTNGCVVSVSSINGQNPVPGASVYCAIKAGLEAMTVSLARELGPHSIRVNAVAPEPTDTPLLSRVIPQDHRASVAAQTPLGRIGASADIASAVAFLVGTEASWITGEIIRCSGGLQ